MKLIDRINEANALIASNRNLLQEKKDEVLTDEMINLIMARTSIIYDGDSEQLRRMLHTAYLMGLNEARLIERFKLEDQLKVALWGPRNDGK